MSVLHCALCCSMAYAYRSIEIQVYVRVRARVCVCVCVLLFNKEIPPPHVCGGGWFVVVC